MDKLNIAHTTRRRGEHAVFYAKNPYPEDSREGEEWDAGWRKTHLNDHWVPPGWPVPPERAGPIAAFREFEAQVEARIAALKAEKKRACPPINSRL